MPSKIKKLFKDETTNDYSLKLDDSVGTVPSALLITVDATHAGYSNRNGFFYDSAAMEYAVSQNIWTEPFEKPLLKNHNMDSEPLGRVVASRFIRTSDFEGFTQLDIKVTDAMAIQKIIDGRYLTVSTSGNPMLEAPDEFRYVKCSICDTDLTKEDWCGHARGKIYEDDDSGNPVKCFWTLGALDYKEVSVVNAPADNRKKGAAKITAYSMIDGEDPVLSEVEDMKASALVFSDSDVEYATEDNMKDEFRVANEVLWNSVDQNKEAYIKAKGLVHRDRAKDITVRGTLNKENNLVLGTNDFTIGSDDAHSLRFENPTINAFEIKDKSGATRFRVESDQKSDEPIFEVKDADGKVLFSVKDNQNTQTIKEDKPKVPPVEASDKLSEPWTTFKTSPVTGGMDYEHSHIVYIDDEIGNGYTDYVLGHRHNVLDHKVVVNALCGAKQTHTHEMLEETNERNVKMLLDHAEDHRHVAYVSPAGNGHCSYVGGHSHEIVNSNVLPPNSTHDSDHTHSLVKFDEAEEMKDCGCFNTLKDLKKINDELEEGSDMKNYFDTLIAEATENNANSDRLQISSILKSLELIK